MNCLDSNGENVLHELAKNKRVNAELIRFLIKKGAKRDIASKKTKSTPLINFINKSANLEVMRELIDDSINENKSFSALCKSKYVSIESLKLFLEYQANINEISNFEKTPLHLLSSNSNSNPEMIKFMVENKANLNQKDHYHDPIFYYLQNTHKKITPNFIDFLFQQNFNFGQFYRRIFVYNRSFLSFLFCNQTIDLEVLKCIEKYVKINKEEVYQFIEAREGKFLEEYIDFFSQRNLINQISAAKIIVHSQQYNCIENVLKTFFVCKSLFIPITFSLLRTKNDCVQYLLNYSPQVSVWSQSFHTLFPSSFKDLVFSMFLFNKHLPRKDLRIPKPILFKIISIISISFNPIIKVI